MSLLEASDLTVYYGPIRAVEKINVTVNVGEVVALLGANGAGKTTVLNAISGLVRLRGGSVSFQGVVVDRVPAAQRVRLGIVQVPEGRRIFAALTVKENLELGAYGLSLHRRERRRRFDEIVEGFPMLRQHIPNIAGMLSGGEQQVLAIARAMMSRPKLLMVDEPSLGLAPQMVEAVYEMLESIAREGTAVLVVEQNVTLALEIAQRALVLQHGNLVLAGRSADLASDNRLTAAYLGSALN